MDRSIKGFPADIYTHGRICVEIQCNAFVVSRSYKAQKSYVITKPKRFKSARSRPERFEPLICSFELLDH